MSPPTITQRTSDRRPIIAVLAVLAMSFFGLVSVPSALAAANAGPYTIDGKGMGGTLVQPANATLGITPAPTVTTTTDETYGSVKELGPVNGTATKVGVIQKAATPMLALTNPNGQVDLRRAWLSTARASATDTSIWQYFAWERDANSGSGFLAFEFNQEKGTGTGCADATAPDAATCNPWNPRTDGDFMIVWDQSGSSTALQIRYWIGDNATGHWGTPRDILATEGKAAFNTNDVNFAGFKGEAAVNLTELFFKNQTGKCSSIARVLPNTVTGNSDSADYKDTIFTSIPPISNCGTITINKTVQNAPNSTDLFGYTTSGGLDTDTATAGVQTTFNLANGGTKKFTNVLAGSYTVTEDMPLLVPGYEFVSLTCTATGTSTTVDPTTAAADTSAAITMGVLGTVVCTYTNHYTNPTSIATQLSATEIYLGGSLHDSAVLTGETATAGGPVEYRVFKRAVATTPDCTISATNPNLVSGASWTVTVANGVVPDSPSFTPTSTGTYDFQAVYSGDANNAGSVSLCGSEMFVVDKAPASLTTVQKWQPQDSVLVAATAGGTPTGTATFKLFTDAACATTAVWNSGALALTNGATSTSNAATATPFFTTSTTVYWLVSYSGDSTHKAITGTCGAENSSVTITNGGAVSSAP